MALKPDGEDWTIKEQIIEDLASGLTLQFEMTPSGEPRLHIFGESLRFGNRTIMFDGLGREAGSGTHLSGLCRPAWLTQIDDDPAPEVK